MKTQWRLPLTAFVFAITNRATTLHSQNETDKISNRNSVRMFAWYLACFARKQRSPKWERRYGRDALSNTSCECVVAKANEADCGAQTPKSKHVRKGDIAFRVLNIHPLQRTNRSPKGRGDVLFYSTRCHALVEEEQIHEEAGKFFCVLTTFFYYNIIISTNISILRICVRADVLKRWQIIRRQL